MFQRGVTGLGSVGEKKMRSTFTSTTAPEATEPNGHTHDNHKLPGSDSPVEIPTLASRA